MNRRVVGLAIAVASVAVAPVVLASDPARANTPQEQGWWAVTTPGGLPVAPPTSPPTAASPDVPSDGLLVQGGPRNPTASCACTAYAGLVYLLDSGATASTLTLKVAPNSATTPSATLMLCPLTNPTLNAEQGGPMSDAPDYDCTHKVTAGPDSSGSSYQFNIGSLPADGSLAVAILPADPTSRVVLSKPDAASLQTAAGAPMSSSFDNSFSSTSAGGSSTTDAGSGGAAQAAPSVPSLPTAGTSTDAGQSPVVATSPSGAPAAPAGNVTPVAASSDTSNGTKPAALALVIAGLVVGGLMWGFAGRGIDSTVSET